MNDGLERLIVHLRIPQTSTTSDTATPRHPFERRLDDVKPSKMDINNVIMDYLINEGYPEAAKRFAEEANIQPPADAAESIDGRVEIRNAILSGKTQEAIEYINDLDPELLDANSSLHFALLRLQLIELIRPCANDPDADIMPVLSFAQTSLAPRAPTNPDFKQDLERTMALLIFSRDSNAPPAISCLLDTELRRTVATKVNEALLKRQGLRDQDKLRSLVQFRAWTERKAREQNRDIPETLDIWAVPSSNRQVEDTVMSHDGDAESEHISTASRL